MVPFFLFLLCNLIWVGYSLTEGIRCGLFDHLRDSWRNKLDFNFSKMLWFQRSLVLSTLSLIMFWSVGVMAFPVIVGQILMFHFLHRLAYKCTKNKVQKQMFETDKKTTNQKGVPMAILGVSIQVFTYLFFM